MTQDAARKWCENKGYKVSWDMGVQAYIARPKCSFLQFRKAVTLNGLVKAIKYGY